MPCLPGYKENEQGQCVLQTELGGDIWEGSSLDFSNFQGEINVGSPTENITCYDGSIAASYEDCPDIEQAWDPAEGIGIIDAETGELGTDVLGEPWTAPSWLDDPSTDVNEWQEYIYTIAGGEEATGRTLDEFWDVYGEDFPTWDESGFGNRYENVLEQLGMLNTSIRLANEDFNLNLDNISTRTQATIETALTQKEAIGGQMESQFISTGGVASGRRTETAKAASENINQALGLEFRGIDIEKDLLQTSYEGELVNIEDRKIDYENELLGLENQYEQHLMNFISMMNIEKCEEGEDCGSGDGALVACTDKCDPQDTDCFKQCEEGGSGEQGDQGTDPSDTGQDEGSGGDPFESYDDEEGGFGEDYDYDDWEDESEYS